MDYARVVTELEQLARQQNVVVTYDRLAGETSKIGGVCRVNQEWWIVLERRLPPSERASTLAQGIADLAERGVIDLGKLELTNEVKTVLERVGARAQRPEP